MQNSCIFPYITVVLDDGDGRPAKQLLLPLRQRHTGNILKTLPACLCPGRYGEIQAGSRLAGLAASQIPWSLTMRME